MEQNEVCVYLPAAQRPSGLIGENFGAGETEETAPLLRVQPQSSHLGLPFGDILPRSKVHGHVFRFPSAPGDVRPSSN